MGRLPSPPPRGTTRWRIHRVSLVSGWSRTRRSALPTSSVTSTRDLADLEADGTLTESSISGSPRTRRHRGSARSRSACSVTTARSTRSRATSTGCAPAKATSAARTTSCTIPCSTSLGADSAMLDNALEFLVHGIARRTTRRRDAHSAGLGARRRARSCRPQLLPLPRQPDRAVGWTGRASCSPTAAPLARQSRPKRPATPAAVDRRRRLRGVHVRSRLGSSCRSRLRYAGSNLAQGRSWQSIPNAVSSSMPLSRGSLPGRAPYGRWLDEGLVEGSAGEPVDPPERDLTREQVLYGYTREELTMFLRPIAGHGHDPTYSMGDDTALPPLAGRSRPLYHYFKQRFAQVTNPPIDHLRERFAMSTQSGARQPRPAVLGRRGCGGRHRARQLLPVSERTFEELSPVRS